MISEKAAKFAIQILRRTTEGRLKWKATSIEDCFATDFSEYSLEPVFTR